MEDIPANMFTMPIVSTTIKLFGSPLLFAAVARCQVTPEIATNRERGLDLSLHARCWQDSDAEISHGALLERPVLTSGHPQHVSKPGAVMMYAKTFSRHAIRCRQHSDGPSGSLLLFHLLETG
jgi:hypothetical protein